MGLSAKNISLTANECQIEITLYGPPAGNSNTAEDRFEDVGINRKTEYRHPNLYGIISYRPKDGQRFISPTDRAPKQLIVQATQEVYDSHRKRLAACQHYGKRPNGSSYFRMGSCLSDHDDKGQCHFFGIFSMSRRVFLVTVPLMIVLSLPTLSLPTLSLPTLSLPTLSLPTEKARADPDFQKPTEKCRITTGITSSTPETTLICIHH